MEFILLKFSFVVLTCFLTRRAVQAACPAVWNCPCPKMVQGCLTCPCQVPGGHVATPKPHCNPVGFKSCRSDCIVLDNHGCFICHCPTPPPSEAPACFECTSVSAPDKCQTVKRCQKGEVCFVRTSGEAKAKQYHYSCMKQSTCTNKAPGALIGRRATECKMCCASDLCNKKLCP